MSHPSSDAVIDFLQVCQHQIVVRIGVEFRNPTQPPPSLTDLLPARYIAVQVASPPPGRTDNSSWQDGLALPDGNDFDPAGDDWEKFGIQPRPNTKPLSPPPPGHLIYNQTIQAVAVSPTAAATSVFALTAPGDEQPSDHCLSVPYVAQAVDGRQAAVNYFYSGTLTFSKELTVADWVAVSPDKFSPGRVSADYIAKVVDCHNHHITPTAQGNPRDPDEITSWWD